MSNIKMQRNYTTLEQSECLINLGDYQSTIVIVYIYRSIIFLKKLFVQNENN